MSILGAEVSGARLAELGIVWQAVPDDQVEPRALELAGQVEDPELVRRATISFRAESRTHAMSVGEASSFERDAQFWSFGRPAPS
jgi:enoyl-CoA hydratase/carnithine racemase